MPPCMSPKKAHTHTHSLRCSLKTCNISSKNVPNPQKSALKQKPMKHQYTTQICRWSTFHPPSPSARLSPSYPRTTWAPPQRSAPAARRATGSAPCGSWERRKDAARWMWPGRTKKQLPRLFGLSVKISSSKKFDILRSERERGSQSAFPLMQFYWKIYIERDVAMGGDGKVFEVFDACIFPFHRTCTS